MPDTRMARRPFSWWSVAAAAAGAVAAGGFVLAVYEALVGSGAALGASDTWILLLWIAATTIAGAGLTTVYTRARALARRVLPVPGLPSAPVSSVAGAVTAGPAGEGLAELAELLAAATRAHTAGVWLAGPSGLRRAAWWPGGTYPDLPGTVAGEVALARLPGVDHVAPVREAGELLGVLTIRARPGYRVMPRDSRLAADIATIGSLLLRGTELPAQVRIGTLQASALAQSRCRVELARDQARKQLGAEIQARVCASLERCAGKAELARPGRAESLAGRRLAAELAEMTAAIDAAIADFRKIVHGVYPAVLADHGLRAALESLLAELDPPAELVSPGMPRLAGRVEAGTYFCAAALVRDWDQAGARRPLTVYAGVTPTLVEMTFIDGGPGDDGGPGLPVSSLITEAVRDRVAALDGSLRQEDSGRRLVIGIPLDPADLVAPRSMTRAPR